MNNGRKDSILLHINANIENSTTTHNFTLPFSNLNLAHDSRRHYQVALLSYSLYYSWYNVSSVLGNNIFRYNNGTTDKTITITDGQYGVSDLNSFIKSAITSLGDDPTQITIAGNFNSLKVDITILGSYTVTFDGITGLGKILGFGEGIIVAGVNSSTSQPNISNSVDAVQIKTSLVQAASSLINDVQSTAIYQFVPKSGPGTNLSGEISSPIYLPMSNLGTIHSAGFQICDNNGNLLDLNNESVSLVFHIKEV